jgi:hypothetical protein
MEKCNSLSNKIERNCRPCTVCCTLCHIPELSKVEGVPCQHCDDGCLIYGSRPPSCVSYECEWKRGFLPEWMRPDQSGVMVEVYPRVVAALLAPGMTLSKIEPRVMAVLNEFVAAGKLVVSSGRAARIPKGMTEKEACRILVDTVREYRNGCVI